MGLLTYGGGEHGQPVVRQPEHAQVAQVAEGCGQQVELVVVEINMAQCWDASKGIVKSPGQSIDIQCQHDHYTMVMISTRSCVWGKPATESTQVRPTASAMRAAAFVRQHCCVPVTEGFLQPLGESRCATFRNSSKSMLVPVGPSHVEE